MEKPFNPSLSSSTKKLPTKLLIIAILFVVALVLFVLIAHHAVYKKGENFDNFLIELTSPDPSDSTVNLMKIFTFFGSGKFLIPGYALSVIYLVIKRQKKIALQVAIVGVTSYALSQVVKRIFQRQRPDIPILDSATTYSFPSGHSFSSFVFFSVLVYVIWQSKINLMAKWLISILLMIVPVTVGISRIILKMHYPTDVLAGFCLGLIWVIFCFWALNRIQFRRVS